MTTCFDDIEFEDTNVTTYLGGDDGEEENTADNFVIASPQDGILSCCSNALLQYPIAHPTDYVIFECDANGGFDTNAAFIKLTARFPFYIPIRNAREVAASGSRFFNLVRVGTLNRVTPFIANMNEQVIGDMCADKATAVYNLVDDGLHGFTPKRPIHDLGALVFHNDDFEDDHSVFGGEHDEDSEDPFIAYNSMLDEFNLIYGHSANLASRVFYDNIFRYRDRYYSDETAAERMDRYNFMRAVLVIFFRLNRIPKGGNSSLSEMFLICGRILKHGDLELSRSYRTIRMALIRLDRRYGEKIDEIWAWLTRPRDVHVFERFHHLHERPTRPRIAGRVARPPQRPLTRPPPPRNVFPRLPRDSRRLDV